MNSRQTIRSIRAIPIAILSFFLTTESHAEAPKPNFLIIIGDDVGYDAFGCTGSTYARTPNIDELAKQSLVLDRFYGTVSQCAPIRAELYTGLFPVNNGKLANAKSIPKPDVKSIVDHLTPLGYDVGLSGKSHFNPLSPHLRSLQRRPQAPHAKSKFLAISVPRRSWARSFRTNLP